MTNNTYKLPPKINGKIVYMSFSNYRGGVNNLTVLECDNHVVSTTQDNWKNAYYRLKKKINTKRKG